MKNHLGCADYLIDQKVDLNITDNLGKSLLSQTISNVSESTCKQVRYLVVDKKADVTLKDIKNNNALHHLAKVKPTTQSANNYSKPSSGDSDESDESDESGDSDMEDDKKEENNEGEKQETTDWSLEMAKILVEAGIDINEKNSEGETALLIAAQNFNLSLISYLLKSGSTLEGTVNGNNFFHIIVKLFISKKKKRLKKKKRVATVCQKELKLFSLFSQVTKVIS